MFSMINLISCDKKYKIIIIIIIILPFLNSFDAILCNDIINYINGNVNYVCKYC